MTCVALIAVPVAPAAHADGGALPDVSAHGPWTLTDRSEEPGDAWRMYRRDVTGSDFSAFRLEATIDAPPDDVAAALLRDVRDPRVSQKNTKKTILRDDPALTLVYSYIEMPIVSDRDVTTATVRSFDPETGSHRVEWHATTDGPAPRPGVVRLEQSSGSWTFSPLPDGRTWAVYENHTDIGGAIPAWLLDRLMGDTVVDGIVSLRARLRRDRPHASRKAEPPAPRAR